MPDRRRKLRHVTAAGHRELVPERERVAGAEHAVAVRGLNRGAHRPRHAVHHQQAVIEARRKALEELQIESVLALPLVEGNDQLGVLILAQNAPRA